MKAQAAAWTSLAILCANRLGHADGWTWGAKWLSAKWCFSSACSNSSLSPDRPLEAQLGRDWYWCANVTSKCLEWQAGLMFISNLEHGDQENKSTSSGATVFFRCLLMQCWTLTGCRLTSGVGFLSIHTSEKLTDTFSVLFSKKHTADSKCVNTFFKMLSFLLNYYSLNLVFFLVVFIRFRTFGCFVSTHSLAVQVHLRNYVLLSV